MVNGVITILTLSNNKLLTHHVTGVVNPSLDALENLNRMLMESKMYATNWVFLRSHQEDKKALLKIHDSTYGQLKAGLQNLSRNWERKASNIQLQEIFSDVEILLEKERIVIHSLQEFADYDDPSIRMEAERVIEDEVIPRTTAVTGKLNRLVIFQQGMRAREQDKLERSSSKLRAFIIILAITIICIGLFLSLHMTTVIISPINKIRNMVNDLGKGRLTKINYRIKKDEIGEMISSVNHLSQKLENTARFAREIGLRNFDEPFQPLSEEDTLGKALITMRDNLKTSEHELNEANSDLEKLFLNIEEVFFSMDMTKHQFLQISPACETVYGYTYSDFETNFNLLEDLILDEDKIIALETYPSMVLGKPTSGEYRIRHKDQSVRWVETRVTPTLNIKGKLVRIDGVTADITERKHAELKYKDSEERYSLLIDNVKDYAIFMLDTSGYVISWNLGAENMTGFTRSDIIGKHLSTLYSNQEIQDNEPGENLEAAMKKGSFTCESLRVRKGGTEFWADVNLTALYDDKGNMRGFAQMIRDVTRTKLADKKIAEFSERLVLATNAAKVGIWDFNPESVTMIWDEGMYRLYGKNNRNFSCAYDAWEAGVHPDDLLSAQVAMQKAIIGEKDYDTEYRVVWDDKSVHYIKALGKVQRNDQGKALRIIGTNWDITEKKTAEELLLKSEANLRTVFNNTEAGYILLDAKHHIVSFNELAQVYYQCKYHQDLVIGNSLMDLFCEEKSSWVRNGNENIVNDATFNYETNYSTQNGSLKWFEISWVKITSKEEKQWGFIITSLDITAQKVLELEKERITADLVQRNKDLEQFTYIVSHNLRAPVANMIGLSSLLDSEGIDSCQKEKIVEGLSLSANNLNTVITDLNDILQTKRQISDDKELVVFSILVKNIRASISNIFESAKVELQCDFSEVEQISTIKSYLYSIFYNFISNSIKYRQQGVAPVIKIVSRQAAGNIELVFKDNGKGIDMKRNRGDLFGLYKRFDTSVEGKGLGLFMVKTQVETLGGKISIESEVNKGTTITIIIPASPTC